MKNELEQLSDEVLELAHLYCEEQLSNVQGVRLNELLRQNDAMVQLFVEYLQLHGQLAWDVGHGAATQACRHPVTVDSPSSVVSAAAGEDVSRSTLLRVRIPGIAVRLTIAAVAVVVVTAILSPWLPNQQQNDQVVDVNPALNPGVTSGISTGTKESGTDAVANDKTLTPIQLDALNLAVTPEVAPAVEPSVVVVEATTAIPEDDDQIVEQIDAFLAESWLENGVRAAPDAPATEWLRRTYLTFAGRIPTVTESREFLRKTGDRRKQMLVQELLQDTRTADNLSVVWLNLLIGRSNPRDVDEGALRDFLREQFRQNEPWIDTVGELIAAEGRSDQNGATNFLLAHLNDQATPATAVTARLFLGQQVHCTQCHDHMFSRDIKQDQFWTLNAFFKQTSRKQMEISLPDGESRTVWELKDSPIGGETHFETLSGLQKVALPEFAGVRLSAAKTVQRRSEFVRLLHSDPEYRVAQSMVNRMWYHFFGAGFTAPVDDMGPHNPPSHPELLEFLTRAYVQSGYDTRRLMMWIAMSTAWQRSSAVDVSDSEMEAALGEGNGALFSRGYARHMLPEQVYDSIRVAIRSIGQQPIESSLGTVHRREWVEQFVQSYGTDENDENLQFDGNISQALLLMNGQELEQAIPQAVHALLHPASGRTPNRAECLEEICLSVLSRRPSAAEDAAFRQHLRSLQRTLTAEQALQTACEDMLWAYLNSSEFIAVH